MKPVVFFTLLSTFLLLSGNLIAQNDSMAHQYLAEADEYKNRLNRDSAVICYKKAAYEFEKWSNWNQHVHAFTQVGVILTRQDQYEDLPREEGTEDRVPPHSRPL